MGVKLVVATAALAAVAVAGRYWLRERERGFRGELIAARAELSSGRTDSARRKLEPLVDSHGDDAELAYTLGLVEEAQGHPDLAIAAWSRVPAGSDFAAKAAYHRARLLIDLGRLAEAEALLEPIPRGRGDDASEVRQTLEFVYRLQGRIAEVRDLIVESWNDARNPAHILWRIYMLDHSAFPGSLVETLSARADPNDDRFPLARANLALLGGRLDEASRLVASCLERRPDDPAVWRIELKRAVATDDAPAAIRAGGHLLAADFRPAERLRLRAWLCRVARNAEAERKILEDLVVEEPSDLVAIDRLAELALDRGARDEARKLRLRRQELHNLAERYDDLIDRDYGVNSVTELAQLASSLGRRTEARGWNLILNHRTDQPLEPEPPTSRASAQPSATLATLLADLAPTSRDPARLNLATPAGARPSRFTDDAAASGLKFVHDTGHASGRPPRLPETMGGGVALLDHDGDGWLDVYVVQGGPFPPIRTPGQEGDRLFRNRRDGTFEDVTHSSGIDALSSGYGHGVTVGDYDNDGRPDLFVTRWRSYALYRNRGDGTFENMTTSAGLSGDRDWPTSAAFADLDNDGDLDLYVCHYLVYDETKPLRCEHPLGNADNTCSPIDFPASPDHVFRNDGGKFVDITEAAGLRESKGRGLGVVAIDLDNDGRVDLYVANDMSENYLYRNLGGFKFEEVGIVSGAGLSSEGVSKAGMGIACGDLDGDGKLDLAVTNFYGESSTFYRNIGQGTFIDDSTASGIAGATRLLLGFGTAFLDANNDGRLDLLTANGHVRDGRPRFPYQMPTQLLEGRAGGRVVDVSSAAGPPFTPTHLGRGLAVGDLDNDGRLDALVVCQNEPLVALHNQTERGDGAHFLSLGLEGTVSNRDAVGAIVTVQAGASRWVVPRFGGGSYQSASSPRLHIGLGQVNRVDQVEVAWPSGRVDRFGPLDADHAYDLREADPTVRPARGEVKASEK